MRLRPVVSNEPVAHSSIAPVEMCKTPILSGVAGKGVDGLVLAYESMPSGYFFPSYTGRITQRDWTDAALAATAPGGLPSERGRRLPFVCRQRTTAKT